METDAREKNAQAHWFDAVGRWAMYGLAFLLPLWVLPTSASPVLVNKVFLAYVLILAALVFWLFGRMLSGSIELPKNFLAAALVIFAGVIMLSGIFSESGHASFQALSGDPAGVVALGFFVLAAVLASAYFKEEEFIFRWFNALFASTLALALFQVVKIAFSLNLAFLGIDLPLATSNIFGTWTEFGILLSVAGFAALFLLEVVRAARFYVFFGAVVAAFLAAALAMNVSIIWWVSLVFLAILFVYLFSMRLLGHNFFRPTLFLLLLVLFCVQVPAIVSIISTRLNTQSVEVRPSMAATWDITKGALARNPVLGSGPGTFFYDWLAHRSADVVQSPFWDIRFSSGAGFWMSLAAMTGIAGIAALLALLAAFLWYGFRVFSAAGRGKPNPFLALTFFTALMLAAYAAVYNPGFVLLLYLFIFIGMFMGLAAKEGIASEYSIKLFANSGLSFISALLVIGVLIGAASFGYRVGQSYVAAYYYGKGVSIFNRTGDAAGASAAIARALDFDALDVYLRGFADTKLSELSKILNTQGQSAEAVQAQFQKSAGDAIGAAQSATKMNPMDPENWKELAQIYEALIPLKIAGVANAALAARDEQAKRNPSSPEPALAEARIFADAGDTVKARERAEAAIALKSNYVPAHLFIAQLEEAAGNMPKAIERMQTAALLNPTEVGTLFQLGLLYYRSDQFQNAKRIFERTVELSPTYSNARYFLGLTYDRAGDRAAALEQFRRVLLFNPENAEVKKIISNLESGKRALAGISSPPENRNQAPVGE